MLIYVSSKINFLSPQGLNISGWRLLRTRFLRSRYGIHLQVHLVTDLKVRKD